MSAAAERPARLYAFAPGRTEIAGNHVDHQGGVVIAATIGCGIAAEVELARDGAVRIESAGYDPIDLRISDLQAAVGPVASEAGTSAALVRGMLAQLLAAGVEVGGFRARLESTIPAGGGLSSSAAFELVVGAIVNAAFADGRLAPLELARMAQRAESEYFGKPCGLMDQAAIASGGIVQMDFSNPGAVEVASIEGDFAAMGLDVCLVDVGADHSGLTELYARIPHDMAAAARMMGADRLCEVPASAFMGRFGEVRERLGDGAAMRALHYYREVDLVQRRAAALRAGDGHAFVAATMQSAASSAQYLQNVSDWGASQPAMVALALADWALDACLAESGADLRGACRIHGGGFGGSIQAYVPRASTARFVELLEAQLGAGRVEVLEFTSKGAHAKWIG